MSDLAAPGDRPLVLLPVRLETRYSADGGPLRIRIYPDEAHIDALDERVTDDEQAAAERYWTSVWAGVAHDDAWAELLRRIQPRRAAWALEVVRPTNPEARPDPPAGAPTPTFAGALLAAPRRQPVARGLPDRFTAVLLADDIIVAEVDGLPVPAELPVGPRADEPLTAGPAGVSLGPGTAWLTDFDAAADVGMAITLPLPTDLELTDLRLFVFGIRSTPDGPSELEAVLRAHRFTSGLEVLAIGAPTNNTERERSSWRRDTVPPAHVDGDVTEDPDSDGGRLTAALGLTAGVMAGVVGAGGRSQDVPAAARAALWPSTFGLFLDHLIDLDLGGQPIMSDATREQLRNTYEQLVISRGPLAPIRLGRQPYGVLPVVASRRLDGASITIADVPGDMQDVLRRARVDLESTPQPTAFTNLPDVLGTAPVLLGLRMRAVLPDLDEILAPIVVDPFGFGATPVDSAVAAQAQLGADYGLNFGRLGAMKLGDLTRPLLLPLVDATDAEYVAALREDRPRRIASVLQALLEVGREAERWPAVVAAGDEALPGDWPAAGDADALRATVAALVARDDVIGTGTLASYQPLPSLTVRPDGPVLSHLKEAYRQRDAGGGLVSAGVQHLVDQAQQVWARATHRGLGFDTAAAQLAAAPADERRLAVAEALDAVSHRLDAWITAMATTRLASTRGAAPGATTVGAYGWLDTLPAPTGPAPKRGGFIHAPSQAHAVTAGILRNANLVHADSGAFAVDLSADRVRTALHVLDAVRQGQHLGSVIGAIIERGLEAAGIARFVVSLRILTSPGPAEAAFATTVIDGVRLLELYRSPATHDGVVAAVTAPPPQNPYLAGIWTPPTEPELTALLGVLTAAHGAYDAVADLMLAESVHQLAAGNPARAASVLDAVGTGSVGPPEPDVVRTPTLGVPVTHRLLVAVAADAPVVAGWSPDAPRAAVEPRMEAWAAGRLGPAGTLAGLGICALDVVAAAVDPDALRSWVRAVAPGGDLVLPDDVVVTAVGLRELLVSARPLTPEDLRSPSEPRPPRQIDVDELVGRLRQAAEALRDAVDQADAEAQRTTLIGYGIDAGDLAMALDEGRRRAGRALDALTSATDADALTDVATLLFGPARVVVPLLSGGSPTEAFASALGRTPASTSQIRGFLRVVSTVRHDVAALSTSLLLADVAGRPVTLRIAQFGPGAPEGAGWIALPFASPGAAPQHPVTDLVVELVGDGDPLQPLGGLVLDEWVEVVPRQRILPTPSDRPPPVRQPPLAASGVAIHADAPAARPPQAFLLAMTPQGEQWSASLLLDTLVDTLDLARLRTVCLERSSRLGLVLPATLYPAFSIRGERVIDFKTLTELQTAVPVPFVRDPTGG